MKPLVILLGCCALLLPVHAADEPKAVAERPLHEISLEAQALRAIYSLRLTDEQLQTIVKFAKETAEPAHKRNPDKASADYRKLLTDLLEALLEQDDDKVGSIDDDLGQLQEKEKPEIDDGIEVTKAARKRTPELFKSLSVTQLATYYGSLADEIQEPLQQLISGLEEVRGLDKKAWAEKRDFFAEEVSAAVAGIDTVKADKVSDKVVALLSKARGMEDEEFKTKKAELTKEAKLVVGDVGPDLILRHHVERTLAELLSNSQLETAIKARLAK